MLLPRVCFVVNPAAGHGRALKRWKEVEPLVRAAGPFEARFTERPRHAEELAREVARQGFDRVGVFGGDGTLNEVANGLAGTSTALAAVPTGTANDWVRNFAIPLDAAEAVRLVYEGEVVAMDLGLSESEAGRRYFLNMVGAGFDAEVAARVNDYGPWLKAIGGTVPTVVSLIVTLFSYRAPNATLELDGQVVDVSNLALSCFGIGGYIGGGMHLLPEAVPDDGLFDVMWASDIGSLDLLHTVFKTYKAGHVGHPKVHFARARRVRVTAAAPLHSHMDGEAGGYLPVSLEIAPKALGVVLPRPSK